HPIFMHYKVGCDADGHLTAVRARMVGDTGAYASVGAKVLERAGGHACGPYKVPNLDVEALAVYTNNPPAGAMRGFGVNQSAFAIEACLDMLAEQVGVDGWEMRWRNAVDHGDRLSNGQRMTKPFGLKRCLEAVRDSYREAKFAGIACGFKNVGLGNGMPDIGRAVLSVEADGTITIRTGFTEMGQGLFTVLIQTAVEETGLPAERFRATTDTSANVNCGLTTASRGTVLGCHGVRAACVELNAELAAGRTLADLAGRQFRGEWIYDKTVKLGADVENPITYLTYGFAAHVVTLDNDGRLAKVIAAHDVGRVMNPTLLEGQIEGSIHMGLGYALTEDFPCESGQVLAGNINACGVLRAHHMPEVEVILIEEPDPDCPYGAKGVGEIGLVPTAAVVNGALYAYDGVRRFALPMKDSPAARAILDPRWKPQPRTP
ncbi:MAG: molybdopterin-dependent oxidoreductase, partial [bacterium]|nr:molybdopterin-dependent oxidoreductase [bacterium]